MDHIGTNPYDSTHVTFRCIDHLIYVPWKASGRPTFTQTWTSIKAKLDQRGIWIWRGKIGMSIEYMLDLTTFLPTCTLLKGKVDHLTLIFMSKHPAMSRKCPTFFTAWKCGHSICFIWYDNLQLGKKDPLRYQVYSNCFFTFMSSTPTSLQIFYYIPR